MHGEVGLYGEKGAQNYIDNMLMQVTYLIWEDLAILGYAVCRYKVGCVFSELPHFFVLQVMKMKVEIDASQLEDALRATLATRAHDAVFLRRLCGPDMTAGRLQSELEHGSRCAQDILRSLAQSALATWALRAGRH